MLGIGAYDSDDEPEAPKAESPLKPKAAAPQAPVAPKAPAKPKEDKTNPKKIEELKKQVADAKSATAVVAVVRTSMQFWNRRWGSLALYQIAKKSTARTRQEWSEDKSVKVIANKLKAECKTELFPKGHLQPEDAEVMLLSLEALRRMALQAGQEQVEILKQLITSLAAGQWNYPVKTLCRLFWLSAPLKMEGVDALPAQIRARAIELGGTDLGLLVSAMRPSTGQGARDLALLEKVVGRLKEKDIHKNLSATDLVEMSEGLAELDQRDEEALRPLGQELQRRRGELTPDEAHRIQNAFQTLKLPLSQVWTPPGASSKRAGSSIVTTQAFVPQEGHEKKRRGNNDIERTSPPRVVRDYKMCSY